MTGMMRKRILTAAALGALAMPMAFSGMASAAEADAIDVSATNETVLTVTIPTTAAIGTVNPTGSGLLGRSGGSSGAYYVTSDASALVIDSNEDYTVAVTTAIGAAPTGFAVGDFRLYKTAPAAGFAAAGSEGNSLGAAVPGWVADGAPGQDSSHNAFFGLLVEWGDEIGAVDADVTFTVTQS